jgi:glycosyltransferase involved in cell wall biosynthesis
MSSNSNPLVSIGIPTYNRATGNLLRVIERSLGQTYKNIEVIVSDNCSSDNTPELVQSIKDPRMRYIRQETNIGPNNNFNYCLNQARGEYFLLFHDDDMIDEDFVEACIASLQAGQSVGAIFTGVRVIDENDNVLEEHPNNATARSAAEFIRGWFQGTTALFRCNTLYNTTRLKEAGGFASKKNLFDDLVPTFTLVSKYGRSDVQDIKAGFRRHSGNRGATVSIHDWVEDSLYLLDLVYRLLPDDRDVLSKEGKLYFCKTMYHYAAHGEAVLESPLDYLRIYKAFDYCYSPWRYFCWPRLGRIKRVIIGRTNQR